MATTMISKELNFSLNKHQYNNQFWEVEVKTGVLLTLP